MKNTSTLEINREKNIFMSEHFEELVSIVMPSYNSEKYIVESINSVVAQNYNHWELIIVDDCSEDETFEIAKRIAEKDRRITLLRNEKNMGAAASRNKAISLARGKWIAFLDSDDVWFPTKLFDQISFMKANNCNFSYTEYEQINEESKPVSVRISGPQKCSSHTLYRYNYLGCLTVMYDQTISGTISIDNRIKSRNDYALWLKIIKTNNKCLLLNKVLGKYRVRKASLSHNKLSKLIKNHYKVFRISEQRSVFISFFCTIRNLFFGLVKKIKYKKRIVS